MATFEGRFDYKTAEPKLQTGWAESGIYEFDPNHPGKPIMEVAPEPNNGVHRSPAWAPMAKATR